MKRRDVLIGGAAAAAGVAAITLVEARRMGSMTDYDAAVAMIRTPLSEAPAMHDLIRYATLAASGHNTQPWRFRVGAGRIDVVPDWSRRTPAVDPDDHHLFVSLGCAAENLALAAGARGLNARIAFDPTGGGWIGAVLEKGVGAPSPLFDAIPRRQSTRADYDGKPVAPADLSLLIQAAQTPGVTPILVTDRRKLDWIRDLVVAGNGAQMADQAFVHELKHWLRFSPRQAIEAGDGLFSGASGIPVMPEWVGPLAFDRFVTAKSENDRYARQIGSSPGVVVFVAEKADAEHWVQAGRSCQRFALQATALGIRHAFINQPVEVAALRPDLANLVGLPGRRPDLVMRFGYGPMLPYSARRPAGSVVA